MSRVKSKQTQQSMYINNLYTFIFRINRNQKNEKKIGKILTKNFPEFFKLCLKQNLKTFSRELFKKRNLDFSRNFLDNRNAVNINLNNIKLTRLD